MRAKTLNEVQNFERGNDPKTTIGVGKAAQIKKMLEDAYKNHHYLTFKMKSPEHIEIFYTDAYKKRVKGAEDGDDYTQEVHIIKYVEKERFNVEENSYEIGSFTHSFGTRYEWVITETKFYMRDDPTESKFEKKKFLDLSKEDKANEERIQVIADALNKHYGKVGGFELINTIK